MNKRLAVLGLGSALVLFAGCGTKEVVVVQVPASAIETVAPETSAVANPDDLFLDRVRRDTDLAGFIPERTMLEFAETVCEFFSNGGTATELVTIMYETGVANNLTKSQMSDFAIMAGVAVDVYCPEFWPLVQA
jgi:hypothetical protein